MYIKQVCYTLSKQDEHILPLSPHFVPRDENKLCTHDKNRKRAELWVKLIRLFNVFVMYALGSVHEKFNNLNRSRFVVKQTNWPCGT